MRILYWPERRPDDRLVKALGELNHLVERVGSLEDALALVGLGGFEAILLDLAELSPGPIASLRRAAAAPWLIVIGSPYQGRERITALKAGADAVFARPVEIRELSAKLDALARLSLRGCSESGRELRLDLQPAEHAAVLNGERIRLSPREYAFLALLVARPGEVVSPQAILEAVWGEAHEPRSELVHAYASRLRTKLERGRPWSLLQAVRGHGYRFRIQPLDEASAGGSPAK